jgi:His-Xaa-Ser system radical SAM maturase HxsC
MLTLASRNVRATGFPGDRRSVVARLRQGNSEPVELGSGELLLATSETAVLPGQPVLILERDQAAVAPRTIGPAVIAPDAFEYLQDGDVVSIGLVRPGLRTLYRRSSPHNSFLLTERCNHYCLMCSQPPKDINDDWLVDEILEAIPLIAKETGEIGFTGGEPTLLGDRLLRLVSDMKAHLPNTALHILSNGRRFNDAGFAGAYAAIQHPDVMLGIPIYSSVSQVHDYVVQSDGAFDETVRGILNLKAYGQRVEIRVVIHRQNYRDLPMLANFIARNLTFVDHVALMGLEMTGFAKANIETLWIDPANYREELREAASLLDDHGLRTSIYNHQLCTVDRAVWPLAVRSISDWKNEYEPECEGCAVRDRCGGFFATGRLRRSNHIRAIETETH